MPNDPRSAKRTVPYRVLPWNGGLNDSVDPGILPPTDLVEADNIIFKTNGARAKRQGHSYIDSDMPTVVGVSSSGTTRTIYFSTPIDTSSPQTNQIVVPGETISISSTDSTENTNYGSTGVLAATTVAGFSNFDFVDGDVDTAADTITETAHGYVTGVRVTLSTTGTLPTGLSPTTTYYTIRVDADTLKLATSYANAVAGTAADITAASGGGTHTLSLDGDKFALTYTASGSLSESLGAPDGTVTVARADEYVALIDFWPYDSNNNTKDQEIVVVSKITEAASNEFKMFSYSISGNRTEIVPRSEQISNDSFDASTDVDTSADTITLTSHGYATGDRIVYDVNSGTELGGLTDGTTYYVIKEDANTIKLATTRRNAEDDVAIDITSKPSSETQNFTVDGSDDTWAAPSTKAELIALNERLIIAFDGFGVKPRIYEPTLGSFRLLEGAPPDFSTMNLHQSRLWTNDKANPDLLHFSPPSDPERWQGLGDSAAIPVAQGDGDEKGITGIFPTYKQALFVGKGQKMYRVLGDAPETYFVSEVSNSLGVESSQSIASVDLDDLVFASHKGLHSLAATDQFGDFADKFISRNIQNRFQDQLNRAEVDKIQAAYVPTLNSVAFAVAERGSDDLNALLFYNFKEGQWFRWPSLNIGCIGIVKKSSSLRSLFFGTRTARLVQTQDGTYSDYGSAAIRMYLKTGTIYPGQDPDSIKGFKKATLYYRPTGNFVFTASYTIDNFPVQALDFQQSASGALLGDTFVLGQSVLSFDNVFAPFTKDFSGYGRGVIIEIEDSSADAQIEIYGYGFEYEPSGDSKETLQSGDQL